MQKILVKRGKTVELPVSLGFNVSQMIFSSRIFEENTLDSTLITVWTVTFKDDGKDGELILTLDESITTGIVQSLGYMDLRNISDDEPVNIFKELLEISFVD